ncbi:MarR family winged helix-turn-helix transcriptional regulator [Marinoscillum sp.]|uniref:MarR family winged helix-turn-helix transcriptional regulator n=1 Tax=Marinoscillum sp. TaxID=2024838 RepID=UPI003BAAF4B1
MDKAERIFDLEFQQEDVRSKIVVGLERIGEVFRALLWDYAKSVGISPIQIQILVFVAHHKPEYCTVSYLAMEFNVTKPTISDAVKVLEQKQMVKRIDSLKDKRSYQVSLTTQGKNLVDEVYGYGGPFLRELNNFDSSQLEGLYHSITHIIYGLNKHGIIQVQRTCYACAFHQSSDHQHFCTLLDKELTTSNIRLDCPEYAAKEK